MGLAKANRQWIAIREFSDDPGRLTIPDQPMSPGRPARRNPRATGQLTRAMKTSCVLGSVRFRPPGRARPGRPRRTGRVGSEAGGARRNEKLGLSSGRLDPRPRMTPAVDQMLQSVQKAGFVH